MRQADSSFLPGGLLMATAVAKAVDWTLNRSLVKCDDPDAPALTLCEVRIGHVELERAFFEFVHVPLCEWTPVPKTEWSVYLHETKTVPWFEAAARVELRKTKDTPEE